MTNGSSINPVEFGNNPYYAQLAQFANAYSITDPTMINYNQSIFNPQMDMMNMMAMTNGMAMGYNPMMMMPQLYSPATFDAAQKGTNPAGGLYFRTSQQFQEISNQAGTLSDKIDVLKSYAQSDNQDDFKKAFDDAVAAEIAKQKVAYPNLPEEQLRKSAISGVKRLYALQTGEKLDETLAQNGDNPFVQGVKNAVSFGIFNDKRTVSENIAMVNNASLDNAQRRREKALERAGFWGTAAVGTAAIAKYGKHISKIPLPGWAKGAIIAGAALFAGSELYSRVTSK